MVKIGNFSISALIEDNKNFKNIRKNHNTIFSKNEYSDPEEDKFGKKR
jgi:hypothetical protein